MLDVPSKGGCRMRTVKEVSAITGISVRTLHYYDEIGLLRPTARSEEAQRTYRKVAQW